MPFTLNPEVGAGLAKLFGTGPPPPPPEVGDVKTRRERVGLLFNILKDFVPAVLDVETKDFHTKADDGHDILCRWFTKTGSKLSGSSAICYAHGGGMISLNVDFFDEPIKRYVSRTGVPFMAIEYRLAPEVQAPIPVTDTYAGLQYLHDHAAELGVDPARIGVMGDSAGGGIAASLAHYVKAKKGPAVCKQILIYPMLDDRNISVDPEIAPFAIWSMGDNETGWGALLGDRRGGEDVKPFEAAARMTVEDARDLPPAYIDVGELDIFRDEDLEYARKLGQAGVSCEFHLVPGAPHAFEYFAPESEVARTTMESRHKAIKSF
ncbi:hypothetical protein LTR36_007408 [Oleoguttula mirabilis]|uniref:Alpha/beta hydrolase fold-3 domain-containing protein n=1 Tax=Oleoguttula mirabilis TaxID=1507867 RepID=A0AAV9J9A6_9PEZI|nr:hypothetical protein LTR36_007408 [Oleoguttula mirabilis]